MLSAIGGIVVAGFIAVGIVFVAMMIFSPEVREAVVAYIKSMQP